MVLENDFSWCLQLISNNRNSHSFYKNYPDYMEMHYNTIKVRITYQNNYQNLSANFVRSYIYTEERILEV